MIVSINKENSDKYRKLFVEAYKYLKELDNSPVDQDKDRFAHLAEYYGHMADFFDNRKYKYVMLPLDEEAFNIDLNTRTIHVPASFSKCASVQSDQLAETIIFVTDRYFDYMDLANTEIYVQWTIPEDKKNGIEEYNGATRVEMVDLESEDGKLRFAWPLNETITATPGVVKFAVRFFRVDDSNPNKLLYSLNTVDTSIVIKPALQPALTNSANLESPISDNSFKRAILNSQYAAEGISLPKMPEFFAPGSNISASTGLFEVGKIKVANLADDTVTLYVQAYTADTSEVQYKWYYQQDDGEFYDCEHYPLTFDADGVPQTYGTFGVVNNDTFIKCDPQPVERVLHEIYYVADATNPMGYVEYVDEINEDTAKTIELYERYSGFTVPAGSVNVTGQYQAAAWGSVDIGDGKKLTTQYPRRSDVCVIPGPSTIMFKAGGNLEQGKILKMNDDNELEGVLTVDLVVDEYKPSINYLWRKSTAHAEDVINAENDVYVNTLDEATLTVTEPGWYAAEVTSTLNRETKHQFSNICKVTNSPEPPVVTSQISAFVDITGTTKENPKEFTIEADVHNPLSYHKALLTDEADDEGNISSFEYIWQMQSPDNDKYMTIKEGTVGIDGLGTKTLKVDKRLKYPGATFRCLVVNKLNGQKAVFDHTGKYDGSDVSLGMFKAEAPYIYDDQTLHFAFSVKNY